MQIAEMEDPGAAAKGLYGISKLLDSGDQRGTFYGSGGLERMQGILANASISDRIHRKIASLFGDLAMRGEVLCQTHYPERSTQLTMEGLQSPKWMSEQAQANACLKGVWSTSIKAAVVTHESATHACMVAVLVI